MWVGGATWVTFSSWGPKSILPETDEFIAIINMIASQAIRAATRRVGKIHMNPARAATGQAMVEASPFGVRSGPGGRSSNSGITATVFGSTGFVGRYFMNELGSCGTRVYAPFRGCELEPRHLKPMFDLGQLGLIPFSPRDDASIIESIQRSDIVINLIGKHYETKHLVPTRRADGKLSRINYDFNEVHCDIARRIARLTKQAGIETLIHVSALSADANSTSAWSRSKAAGELAVREEFPDAIIVKPSTIFGPEDRFLNLIATINADSPVVPIVNNGDTLVQPVYSLDVAKALHTIVQNHRSFKGATFQLTGPAEYSYREIVEFVQDVSTVTKPIMAVPDSGMNFAGKVFDTFIAPIHTPDMVAQMNEDCVAIEGKGYKTLEDLGIEPSSMDKYSFDFLHRFRPGGHFTMVQGYH